MDLKKLPFSFSSVICPNVDTDENTSINRIIFFIVLFYFLLLKALPTSAIPKAPKTIHTNESYMNSLITKSLPM